MAPEKPMTPVESAEAIDARIKRLGKDETFWKRLPDGTAAPATAQEWAEAVANGDMRKVALTRLPDSDAYVSTAFVGLNMSHDEVPRLWETALFIGGTVRFKWAYRSEAEARAGHAHAVEWAMEGNANGT